MSSTQPNLASGFKNNISQFPMTPQTSLQVPQSIPQPVPMQAPMQPIVQYQQPSVPMQSLSTDVVTDSFNIFGQVLQKKYVYIFLIILLLGLTYLLWSWYNKKTVESDDEEDDDVGYEQQMMMMRGMHPSMLPHSPQYQQMQQNQMPPKMPNQQPPNQKQQMAPNVMSKDEEDDENDNKNE